VAEQDATYGPNSTASLVEHVDRARDGVRELVEGMQPLPGQVGVLIGIAGQRVMAEVFDSPSTLRRQFRSIVEAAAFDAVGQDPIRTTGAPGDTVRRAPVVGPAAAGRPRRTGHHRQRGVVVRHGHRAGMAAATRSSSSEPFASRAQRREAG
jgi:hypothetical protein